MLKLVEQFYALPSMRATVACLSRRLPSLGLTTASTKEDHTAPMPARIEDARPPTRRGCSACRAHQQGPRLGGSAY